MGMAPGSLLWASLPSPYRAFCRGELFRCLLADLRIPEIERAQRPDDNGADYDTGEPLVATRPESR